MVRGEQHEPLFKPFRALGYVSEDVPFCVQRRGKETYVTVSVGRSWQIYDASRMYLKLIGPQLEGHVTGLAAKGDVTFAALRGGRISACKRVRLQGTVQAHQGDVVGMLVLGDVLVTAGSDGVLRVWETSGDLAGWSDAEAAREMRLESGFEPTCIAHPDTYLNKVLVGSRDGRMQLWNFASAKMVYEFASLGSAVRCIASSPALDVVAVGLADGRCVLRNLRYDEHLMTFSNAAGAGVNPERITGHDAVGIKDHGLGKAAAGLTVTALSFRTGPGKPLLAAGGSAGVVTVWNLDERRLEHVIKDAHDGALLQLFFFPGEPVLMSSATDNSVKQWIFDNADGTPRLLRFRAGHAAPPTCVRHYGDGRRLLSAARDRSFRLFSAVQDQQSRELSQGQVKRRAKRLRVKEEEIKLTPVVAMDAGEVRERDWANVVTAHEGDPKAYTWRLKDGCLGEWVLHPPRDRSDPVPNAPATAVSLSSCGNFALVGSASGRVDKYNMQSGIHRGAFQRHRGKYGKDVGVKTFVDMGETSEGNAHSDRVTGVSSDACNRYAVSCSLDGHIRVWSFKTRLLLAEDNAGVRLVKMAHHRHSALVAAAGEDLMIRVWDAVSCRVVRRFTGHKDRVTDMVFSEDARWLITSAMDGHVRVWDVPNARCLQVAILGAPVTSLSLSPGMDLLATAHANRRGIYVWTNQAVYGDPGAIAPSDSPVRCHLPAVGPDGGDERPADTVGGSSDAADWSAGSSDDSSEEVTGEEDGGALGGVDKIDPATGAPVPIAPDLVTTSLLPRAQWMSLADLALIKERNKPIAPPQKPKAAPFFIPTASDAAMGRKPVFDVDAGEESGDEAGGEAGEGSRLINRQAKAGDSDFIALLRRCDRAGDHTSAVAALRAMKPSALDAEIRSLEPLDEAEPSEEEVERVGLLLSLVGSEMHRQRNFEFINAVLRVVLDVHTPLIQSSDPLRKKAQSLKTELERSWGRLGGMLNEVACMVGFFGSLQGET